MLTDITDQS